MGEQRICLGEVVGVHGVKGLVRVRPFTEEPDAVAGYGDLQDQQGRPVKLTPVGRSKGVLLARVEGVDDRDRAEALRGTRLYVARERLPAIEEPETYYHADLIGLDAETLEGQALGRVTAVHDFGAGDILEIEAPPAEGRKRGESRLVPFTRDAVPEVDPAAGTLVVRLREATGGPEAVDNAPEGAEAEGAGDGG